MSVFEFEDYRSFVRSQLGSLPKARRGELSKLAATLGVNSSFLSQVLKGTKNLSLEQAFLLAQHFRLSELETRFFAELVNLDRAVSAKFKNHLRDRIETIRAEARWKDGLPELDQPLDERNQAIFYSSWTYSAVQLLTGIDGFQSVRAISNHLGIREEEVQSVSDFLLKCGLCTMKDGRIQVGRRRTHLSDGSPLRPRHQMNWRLKAIDQMPKNGKDDLFFTAPMRIDEETFKKIRGLLEKLIQESHPLIDQADDRVLACLNVDLFRI